MKSALFTLEELATLAARAETLGERLQGRLNGNRSGRSPLSARQAHRASEWRRIASNGDEALFHFMLRVRGVDPQACNDLFATPEVSPATPTPGWVDTFAWLLEAMRGGLDGRAHASFLDATHPAPFEELLVGPVLEAMHRLDASLASSPAVAARQKMSDRALAGMQRSLMLRLASLMAEPLYLRFHYSRTSARPTWSGVAQEGYARFVSADRDQLLRELFDTLPVLARLAATVAEQWIETSKELLLRLAGDWNAIEQRFAGRARLEGVVDATPLDSDRHNGGRSVWVVTFNSGLRVVYKPRPMALEAGWANLMDWLDGRGAPPSADAGAVLDRVDYGWMEWISPGPEGGDPGEYFERFGAMLCLVHLLDGTDLHFENIIARGPAPVAIDLETLFHPRAGLAGDSDFLSAGEPLAVDQLRNSIVWTGLLPSWVTVRNRQFVGIGGLNPQDAGNLDQTRFININTDRMSLGVVSERHADRKNLPTDLTDVASLSRVSPRLLKGFRDMWKYVAEHRAALMAESGPLEAFRSAPVRVILRPTQLYFLILKRAQSAACLVDGAVWSAQFDLLWRFVTNTECDIEGLRLLEDEARSLARMDIPYFRTLSDGRDLETDRGVLRPAALPAAPFDAVTTRLRQMGDDDLEFQLSLIEQSFGALSANPEHVAERQDRPSRPGANRAQSKADFVGAARDVAEGLLASSVGQRGANWIGASPVVTADHSQVDIAGQDLYSGVAGIGLFFAALERVQGDGVGRGLASRSLALLVESLGQQQPRRRLQAALGLGGATGLGSIVYALARVSQFLAAPEYLEAATTAARLITPDDIAADQFLDVMDGSAGAILGLLALAKATGEAWPVERAVLCGQHLLARQGSIDGGAATWRTVSDAPLAGMAHGAAGISMALLRLSAAASDPSFAQAALEGMKYERSLFDPVRGGWPDLRQGAVGPTAQRPVLCRWCHGAPGIGLARLGAFHLASDAQIQGEIDAAIEATLPRLDAVHDGLCCGNFGRIELMFTAGLRLERRELTQEALEAASRRLQQRQATGGFQWGGTRDRFNPGFHTGVAGIGYQLLRMEHPDLLPSILTWE